MQDLQQLFKLQAYIRIFFGEMSFQEVIVPPIVENPGMEVHIHPFQINSVNKNDLLGLYLHTSPEFRMKELLSKGMEKIFNMGYVFRDEPHSNHHRHQFVMLEWYRANESYQQIKVDLKELYDFCWRNFKENNEKCLISLETPSWEEVTVDELFNTYLNFSILDYLSHNDLYEKIKSDFKEISLNEDRNRYEWDDLFFLLFLNKIEPHFQNHPYLIVDEYPAPLSALSTLKPDDPRVCQRFEAYVNGVELCNCFNELTDLKEQKKRFIKAEQDKENIYNYKLPSPNSFYESLNRGLPTSAGVALGVERLLLSLINLENPFFD